MADYIKTKNKSRTGFKRQKGQTLPIVIIISVILSLMAMALLRLFTNQATFQVKYTDSMDRQELANIALQHAMTELQEGTNWNDAVQNSPQGLTGFRYDQEYTTARGTYKLNIVPGNLFINTQTQTTGWGWHRTSTTTDVRQNQNNYMTIGIKVKSSTTKVTHEYYAVVKQGYGGPLISNGIINLPCLPNDTSKGTTKNDLDFYWGDVYSANPANGACNIPFVQVAKGTDHPPGWMPQVYAAGNIYTALNPTAANPPYTFGYVSQDMSPTAHSHPFSPMAQSPQLDLDYYKTMASQQGNYFGPKFIGGGSSGTPNPYYNQGNDLSMFLPANNGPLANDLSWHLNNTWYQLTAAMVSPSAVVFIDTTDALPEQANGTNTYCYSTIVPSTQYTSATAPQALSIYANNNTQGWAVGSLYVMGPLLLIGDNPDEFNGASLCSGWTSNNCPDSVSTVSIPSNYYYPQDCNDNFGSHLSCTGGGWSWGGWNGGANRTYYTINNVKFNGFLYVNGELRIGGKRVAVGNQTLNTSDVCIYGSIFIDKYGELTEDTTNDTPNLWVYFNSDMNMFSFMGNNVILISFGDFTFLVPTPGPY